MGASRTSKYYASNPKARKKRVASQAKINRKPAQKKRRPLRRPPITALSNGT